MADATGTEPEEWHVWRRFLAVHAQLSLEVDRRLRRDHGLQPGEYGTLASLRDAGGRLRIGQLAEALGWEKSRASHLMSRMEARGLVERADAVGDGRGTEVVLTPHGSTTLLGAVRSHAADVRTLFWDRMSASERDVIAAVSTRILDGLAHEEEAGGGVR